MLKKNIIANYIGQFYTIFIGIFMVPFYLLYLGAEAYGLVGFFALMTSWMALLDMGMSPTLSREVAKVRSVDSVEGRVKFKNLLHSLEFVFVAISTIVVLLVVSSSDIITQKWLNIETLDLQTVSYCISLMGVMMGLRFVSSLYRSGIAGAEQQVWLNIANMTMMTLKFVGVFVVLYFISTDVKYFFEYQFVIAVLEFFVFSIKFYSTMDIGRFKIYFSYQAIKPILPFALGIAYTAGIWVFLTQLDKMLLSGILPLAEYGYFALVGMVANAVLQISSPISKAILPRMVSLHNQHNDKAMIHIYKKSTQLMSIFVFSIVAVVGVFSYELLYSWTGNIEASLWAKDILFWYVMGNGILGVAAFAYYLQFTIGDLKLHVRYNTFSAAISIPLIVWAAYTHGALGVAIVWFVFRLVSFLLWTPYIHHKFAPGIHKDWMLKDILPVFLSTVIYIELIQYLNISFDDSRGVIFGILVLIGLGLLVVNSLVASEGRKIILGFVKGRMN